MNLNKVIIWGHELHNHTHSYIHNAFYRTFKHLGYNVYWFNEDGQNNYHDDNKVDFNNALYIVHGLESKNLPLNETSYYICHNVEWNENENGYKIPKNHNLINESKGIVNNNIIFLQVYSINCLNEINYDNKKYYYHSINKEYIYIPWGTDLLPYEIDENIKNLESFEIKNISNFIGMPLEHNVQLRDALKKYNIEYENYGGTFDKYSDRNKSIEENMKLIQESIIAPSLQTQWQKDNHYIPCRIFKNISYGKMGITNSQTVYKLFNEKIIYSDNIEELVDKSLEFNKRDDKFSIIKELMIEVRDNHTYVNRINFIIEFLKKYKDINII